MTTTPNYGGVLPTVGGDSGTWGDENNTLHNLWDTTIKAVSDASNNLITSTTFSGAGAPGISTLAGFNAYVVTFYGIVPSGNPTLTLQLSFDGSTWKSGSTDYAYNIISATNLVNINRSNGSSGFLVTQNTMDTTASKANTVIVELFGPQATGFGTMIKTASNYWSSSNMESDTSVGQIVAGYGSPVGVRLVSSTGTLTGGLVAVGLPGY